MNYFTNIISESFMNSLGYTILHSLWIGAVILLIYNILIKIQRQNNTVRKYNIAYGMLIIFTLSVLSTFGILYYNHQTVITAQALPGMIGENNATLITNTHIPHHETVSNQWIPYLYFFWLTGVLFFTVRLIGGWIYIQRLR